MIDVENVTLSFGGQTLFEDVSVRFTPENCYGLIGANGAGKSTFLKILSGDIESTRGDVNIPKDKRISVLKQDQFAFDDYSVIDAVISGHDELYAVYKERTDLYAKSEMTEAEGIRVADLEGIFGEMEGYTKEADAAMMLSELGIPDSLHDKKMSTLEAGQKIRVLLSRALFGDPDILLLDEPTNQLDYDTVLWLENFLLDFKNTVIVISHDRHFLNKVCTHIADLDFKKLTVYVGNYDFWQQASELVQMQQKSDNKKKIDKVKELEDFIRRFSANASKSKQATSRKKLLEKIRPEELPTSTRKFPYINFTPNRMCGDKILELHNISHSVDGVQVLKDVSFDFRKGHKIALLGQNSISKTTLLQIIAGEIVPDEGELVWGETITKAYFPKDNSEFFEEKIQLLDWLSEYSTENDFQVLRGFLGRMLFSGDDVDKSVTVLSGGEKARAMFSKMMLTESNFLIFDEPTDHLDLEAITSLNKCFEAFDECMIFTSHDYKLLDSVANRIVEVGPEGMIDRQTNFGTYMSDVKIHEFRQKKFGITTPVHSN